MYDRLGSLCKSPWSSTQCVLVYNCGRTKSKSTNNTRMVRHWQGQIPGWNMKLPPARMLRAKLGVSCGRKNRTLCIDSWNITPPVEYCQNICFYCRSLWWVSMKHWGCFRRADFKTNWTMWTSSGKLLVFGRLFRPLSRVELIRYAQNIGLETQNWGWISVLFCHSNDYCFIILHFHYWFIILP